MELNKILEEIDKRLFLIVSDEIYFLNSFVKTLKKIVPNEFKDFNEYTLFADEIKFQDLILKSSNFPLMGSKQVFFIKNSSKFSKDFELHLSKLLSTNPNSILVFLSSDTAFLKKKKIIKFFDNNGVSISFKKIYENQISSWIVDIARTHEINLSPKICYLISEICGNNLSLIDNEFSKLKLNLNSNKEVDEEVILETFGINKQYNIFELQNYYGKRKLKKVIEISEYFSGNNKNYPIQLVLASLYSYYQKIFQIQSLKNQSKSLISKETGINPYFLDQFMFSAQKINMKESVRILAAIKKFDLKSKGIEGINDDSSLLKQLALEILT